MRKCLKKSLTFYKKGYIIKALRVSLCETMQVSPSGMATASQAVPGRFDSGHLLHRYKVRYERYRTFLLAL